MVYGGVVVRCAGGSAASLGTLTTVSGEPDRCGVGVVGLGYANGWMPSPLFVGEVGDVNPLPGDPFLPTLSGTIGLMGSLRISKSSVSVVTNRVTAACTSLSDTGASESDCTGSVRDTAGETSFRGSWSGLAVGSSFNAGTISERPDIRLQGSTGAGLDANRPMRSVNVAFFFSGPDIVAEYPMGRLSEGVAFAYDPGLTEAALPALLGSPE